MGDEPFTKPQTTYSRKSGTSTSQHQAAYAVARAKVLFGSYRRGDANDPEAYVAAISAVLSVYDPDLIREVTDPRTGIATSEKYMSFMPNAGELKVYCEVIAARRDRIQKLGALPGPDPTRMRLPPPEPRPGDLANVFVPAENPRYPSLVEWAKTADPRLFKFESKPGIWVAHDVWDQRQTVARPRAERSDPARLALSEDALRAMREADENRKASTATQPEREAAE